MALHTISAHFDGQHICLDKKLILEPNEKLWVTYTTSEEDDNFREDWSRMGMASMAALYERDEADAADLVEVMDSIPAK